MRTNTHCNGAALDDLAAEYLSRQAQGQQPDLNSYLARLSSRTDRRGLREILRDVSRVAESLPSPHETSRDVRNFQLIRKIGNGGMGVVYTARDRYTDRLVAVKVLAPDKNKEMTERFHQEVELMGRLDHANIVSIHESGTVDGVHYLVMDLVDGVSLERIFERLLVRPRKSLGGDDLLRAIGRPLPEGKESLIEGCWYSTVARIMCRAIGAVAEVHAQGIVHRDLKPNNLMLTGGGHPVLLDFGLAGNTGQDSDPVASGLYGTIPYLAPEQLRRGRTGAEISTDIYQLGLLFYELLALQPAFSGHGVTSVVEAVERGRMHRPREVRRSVPADLERVCLKAMSVRPRQRYESAIAMGLALDSAARRTRSHTSHVARRLLAFGN